MVASEQSLRRDAANVCGVTFVAKKCGLWAFDLLIWSCGETTSHGRASFIVDTRERMGLGRLRRNTAW